MTTMCVTVSPGGRRFRSRSTCSTISPGGQVPLDPLQPAGAEDAAHAAADLRADADRPAVLLGHQDALDPAAVAALQQQLVRAVGRDVMEGDPGAEDAHSASSCRRSARGRSDIASNDSARRRTTQSTPAGAVGRWPCSAIQAQIPPPVASRRMARGPSGPVPDRIVHATVERDIPSS